MLPGWASWVVVSRDAQTLSVPLPIVNAGCWLFMVAGDEVPVVERRLISACAGVFAPLTAGMGLAGFTRF